MSYIGRVFDDKSLREASHRYLGYALAYLPLAQRPHPGLLGGIAGLCFAVRFVAPGAAAVRYLLADLETRLSQETIRLAEIVGVADGMGFNTFDAISGLAGIGRYWLAAQDSSLSKTSISTAVHALTALIGEDLARPRWYTPSGLNDDADQARDYPSGTLNCGLAHGIPGPITFLSLALEAGFSAPSTQDALRYATNWLLAAATPDEYGDNWPTVVPVGTDLCRLRGARAAWCYGAPGISRALFLSGRALMDQGIVKRASEAMRSVYKRPVQLRRVVSPILCHGLAGLLITTLRLTNERPDMHLLAAANGVCEELMQAVDQDAPLLYRDVEPTKALIDRPGLLEGALGVALALAATATTQAPDWDKALLLS